MYDKAIRNLQYNSGSTPQNVGPGTYDQSQSQISRKPESYAPFMSLTARQSHFTSDPLIAPPGPGQYESYHPYETVNGLGASQPKAERFFNAISGTPGPGSYNITSKIRRHTSSKKRAESAQQVSKRPNSRLKFPRKIEAPSIPIPGKCHGYEENEDGTLKRQDSPERDTTLGPAYYKPDLGATKGTRLYRGCHWGNYTSQRNMFINNDVPGPGEYDVGSQSMWRVENPNMGEMEIKKFESYVPRYLDAVIYNEKKLSIPGPADYVIKRQFEDTVKYKDELEMDHPPFLSQSKRFQGSATDSNPAPGAYNDPRTSLQYTKRLTGMKKSPFGQTAVRFHTETPRKGFPGPGSYNFHGMSTELSKKAYMESTRRGAFGSTGARKIIFSNKDQIETPGPSHYKPKEKPFQSPHKKLTSSFVSTTTREIPKGTESQPGPETYEVARSFERSQLHHEGPKPRSGATYRKNTGFLSSTTRFAHLTDFINEFKDTVEVPGPGSYEAKPEDQQKYGSLIGRSLRFTPQDNDIPGPGTYEMPPLVADTLIKGTFNVTLAKPVPVLSTSQG